MNIIFYHRALRGVLAFWALFICLALVWALMKLYQQKRFRVLLPVLLLFAGCDIYWQYLNAGVYYVGTNEPLYFIDSAPIWLIVLINTILTAAAVCLNLHIIRRQKRHVSAVSVKESFDTLPSGVCFYIDGGRTYLVNEAMERIVRSIAGHYLYNGEKLWQLLRARSIPMETQTKAIVSAGENHYSFTRYTHIIGTQRIYELIAVDITDEVAQNQLLAKKNAELERLNDQLAAYNRNLEQIVRERQLLQSKTKIHDEMNILIVSTMNALEHYDVNEANRLVSMWNRNVLELEKDTEPYRANPTEALESLAKSLGITLILTGVLPKEKKDLRLLIAAVSECMVNAIRHANAETLCVSSNVSGAVITNDGAPPRTPVTEGGGLSNLRKRAEEIGAHIRIESAPAFSLTLTYEKREIK